ncbi:peptide-methionine (S)-S-oxide reductase MsrA [Methanosarcina sp. 2.H.A.1B.4]|uniref:peptide-methionine (S)-S-oxide reductase MsrA n=1 Tax=Methanosarcina sp. 2.H.A.1B.4 TaxID=1483600 RepID=UPI000622650F|nr:peptide-methionine (S)-S-oxide reductase MsrA [Methanosarcina sp. 2.H.A.1B.4]KKG12381.1 peptide methionine sulfoxide reductase [Methanosarcina sp. 2.H.A.1B.4]
MEENKKAEQRNATPEESTDIFENPEEGLEKATFAAGCFWGIEEAFRQVKGVVATAVGYSGGHFEKPTYEQVCTLNTGHAEAIRVIFDPKVVSYQSLLDVFWKVHDPTTKDRQGPDVGKQYRSVIFYHSEEQKAAALASKEGLEKAGAFKNPIVTEIVPVSDFYMAEDYHQQYFEKKGFLKNILRKF